MNESQNPCLRGRFIYVYRTGGRCDCPSAMGNSLLGIFSPMGMYMGRLLWDFHTWRAIAKWESKFELMEETSNVWSTVSLSWPTPYRRWRFSLSVCECRDCFFFFLFHMSLSLSSSGYGHLTSKESWVHLPMRFTTRILEETSLFREIYT